MVGMPTMPQLAELGITPEQSIRNLREQKMNALEIGLFQPWMKRQVEQLGAMSRAVAMKIKELYDRWHSTQFSSVCYLMIVAIVAVYDTIMTVTYAASLQFMEENPIGRWLMGLHNLSRSFGQTPDLSFFLTMKVLGTVLVLAAMYFLIRWRARIGNPVSIGVSSFQIFLAFYLTFGANS